MSALEHGSRPTLLAVAFASLVAAFPAASQQSDTPTDTKPAAADQTPEPKPPQLTMQRIENGFVIAPDNQFTNVDGHYGNLLGLYGGYMMDHTYLIGAGGYWLTNGDHVRDLSYGGLVFEWIYNGDHRLSISTRALIGGGSATLPSGLVQVPYPPYPTPYHGHNPPPIPGPNPVYVTAYSHDGFFAGQPQINFNYRLNGWLHLSAGGGYRFIAGTYNMDSRLRGATGSLSLQIGGGS
jgi:hypothetical protein